MEARFKKKKLILFNFPPLSFHFVATNWQFPLPHRKLSV